MHDKHILKALVAIGRCQEIVKRLEENDLFDNLSKHNAYWQSEHEIEGDKLDSIRLRLLCLTEDLAELISNLSLDDDDLE